MEGLNWVFFPLVQTYRRNCQLQSLIAGCSWKMHPVCFEHLRNACLIISLRSVNRTCWCSENTYTQQSVDNRSALTLLRYDHLLADITNDNYMIRFRIM